MQALTVTIGSAIRLKGSLSPELAREIEELLTIPNPVWLENNKFGRFNKGVPKDLYFFRKGENGLTVPRGYARSLLTLLSQRGCQYTLEDKTRLLPEISLSFHGSLYSFQEQAASRIMERRFGVARLPTGAGKTVLALYCIAQRAQPAAVIVHTKELLHQWKERALEFLDIPGDEVGLVGDGKRELGRKLTICVVNSLYKCAKDMRRHTGHLIVDECHRIPSRTFTEAVRAFDSRYMLGLSATPFRRDGLTPLISLYLGDPVYQINAVDLQEKGRISTASLVVRKTRFDYSYRDDYQDMASALSADWDRNRLIATDAADFASQQTGPALVVSDRKNHCRVLGAMIADKGPRVGVLTGDLPDQRRKEVVQAMREGRVDVLVATVQLIGEGFDCPALSAVFLATPVKFTGRVLQVVGRILRSGQDKSQALIYDYVDMPGVLQASFHSRLRAYRQLGVFTQRELPYSPPG